MAQGTRYQGGWGSLDNGTARPVLSSDALVRSRNTEHLRGGAITLRPGRSVHAQVASQPSLRYAPFVDDEFDTATGQLEVGKRYYARATYVTAAGETDDLHADTPGQVYDPTVTWVATANTARIAVPCNIRRTRVQSVGSNASGFVTCVLEQPPVGESLGSPVQVAQESLYIGWLMYSRSPRLQDETSLGTNPYAADPLYHRVDQLGVVSEYNQTTRVITLNVRDVNFGLTGFLDRDLVDFMMPDRAGLPVIGFNVYLSDDNVNFFWAGTGVDGSRPIGIFALDATQTRAPSTRVDRGAPTILAVDVRERVSGRAGQPVAKTRLKGGIYSVRTTYTSGDNSIMVPPGTAERNALLGFSIDPPSLRCEQETWPSRIAYVALHDDEGISVTPVAGPEVNSGWSVYGRRLRPLTILVGDDNRGVVKFNSSERTAGDIYSMRQFDYTGAIFYGHEAVPASSFATPPQNTPFLDGPEQSQTLTKFYNEFYDDSVIIQGPLDPFAAATRGFPPGYDDIREVLDADGLPYFTYASSRDDIPRNQQLYWFERDSVTDAWMLANATHCVLKIVVRIRPGKVAYPAYTGDTTTFIAGDDRHVNVRYWNENSQAWVSLERDIGLTDWFTEFNIPFNFDPSLMIVGRDSLHVPTTSRFLVCDINATNCVGFDVSTETQLEFYRVEAEDEDPAPEDDEVLQRGGIQPIKAPFYILQNPLAERAHMEDGSDPGLGEWESIRPNNTAQWPCTTQSLPIVGRKASSQETKTNFVGCADSCFRDTGRGVLERIFQEEGMRWNSVLRYDWRFENYLNRIFFCNLGDNRWNYRFDGVQTYAMGLPKPLTGITQSELDAALGQIGNQGEVPEPVLYGDRCLPEELFAGLITSINETTVKEGDTDPGGFVVIGFDAEYYLVYKRTDPATGRSYVVRSEPARFTKTTHLRGAEDFPPTVTVSGFLSPEPQVTHIEIYRNRFATADYYLVSDIFIGQDGVVPDYSTEGTPITDIVVDPATARLIVSFSDQIDVNDADLTLPIDFETGRPLAAAMMKFNRGRIFYAPQRDRTQLAWTNITSPSGDVNPEGWYVKHVMEPPVRESSAITCLSVYNDGVVVSCNTGMVSVQGISDSLNGPSALSPSTLATDGGWMGPDAFCDVDAVQWGMTRQGPAVLGGGELNFVGPPIEGTLLRMVSTTESLFNSRCVHYRTAGRTQVWFTYQEEPGENIARCLVFDEGVNSGGDRQQFWKEWTQMPVHGLASSRDSGGVEYPLLAGSNGRLYRHGLGYTDAGLLIERDLATRPFETPGQPTTFMPWWAYFYTTGQPCDLIMLDLWPDFMEEAMNQFPVPVPMGGNCGLTWGQAVGGYPGDVWGGDGEKPYTVERINMSGIFRQIQYRLFLTWETWPVGKDRCINFETTGFNPFGTAFGPRDAKASAGARK